MTDNMHPADELYELRRQKGEIDRRIKEVRTLLLELPPEEREGSWYAADVVCQKRTVLDKATITKEMGKDWVDARSTTATSQMVRLVPVGVKTSERKRRRAPVWTWR